jgi:hypothetical protein
MRDEVLGAITWLERFCNVKSWQDGSPVSSISKFEGVRFVVEEAWIYAPASDARPLAFINELYEKRREIKEQIEKTGQYNVMEKVIKLLLNSLYGKLAQTVGGIPARAATDDDPGSPAKPPPTAICGGNDGLLQKATHGGGLSQPARDRVFRHRRHCFYRGIAKSPALDSGSARAWRMGT